MILCVKIVARIRLTGTHVKKDEKDIKAKGDFRPTLEKEIDRYMVK